MQVIRTVVWVLVTVVLVAFIAINWTPVAVNIWPLDNGTYLHFQWPVGFIVLISFLLGMLPMWLLAKAGKWRLTRRISSLENTVKATAVSQPSAVATTTQLETAAPENPIV